MAKLKKAMQVGAMTITPLKGGQVRLSIGKEASEVSYKDLWGVIFVIGSKKYRDEMIPVKKKEMMQFVRVHRVEVTKDIKKGEIMQVHCEVNVPQTVVEAIAEKEGAKVIMPES